MNNINVVGLVVVGIAVVITAVANKAKKPAARQNRNLHTFNENSRLFNEAHMRTVNNQSF